jgi:hypothetical protein
MPNKEPLFPLDVPVQALFSGCKYYRSGIITKERDLNYSPPFKYMFTYTEGKDRGNSIPANSHVFSDLLVNGERWEYTELTPLI